MRYFKRYWEEPRGDACDACDAWGRSWWYFETDRAGVVLRQLEIYNQGPTLRYSGEHREDSFGGLSERPLDLAEFAQFEVSPEEFEDAWSR